MQGAGRSSSLGRKRCAVEHAGDASVSVVPLPTDDMKGASSGGRRNIYAPSRPLTGVPDHRRQAVTLSHPSG